jgi:hypothetical protein
MSGAGSFSRAGAAAVLTASYSTRAGVAQVYGGGRGFTCEARTSQRRGYDGAARFGFRSQEPVCRCIVTGATFCRVASDIALGDEVDRTSMFEEIVGTSPALRTVLTSIAKAAPTEFTVLVTGETEIKDLTTGSRLAPRPWAPRRQRREAGARRLRARTSGRARSGHSRGIGSARRDRCEFLCGNEC